MSDPESPNEVSAKACSDAVKRWPVTLNVYDLLEEDQQEKKALELVHLGLYHSGIEVHGKEWSFGGQSRCEVAGWRGRGGGGGAASSMCLDDVGLFCFWVRNALTV